MSGEHARSRLTNEPVIWLTTVRPSGQPQTSPVWFLLHEDEILVYSLDDTARIANIAANPRVALNLDGNGRGGDIVTIEGVAAIDRRTPPPDGNPSYLDKYSSFIARNGWTPQSFARDYPIPIRIRIERIRSW